MAEGATCETRGHLWGSNGRCVMCKTERPKEQPMGAMMALPDNHPIMQAWRAYKESADFANSKKWAVYEDHTEGSLWAAFLAGWQARQQVGHDG